MLATEQFRDADFVTPETQVEDQQDGMRFTKAQLRYLIRKGRTNGLKESGAVRKISGRWIFHKPSFYGWVFRAPPVRRPWLEDRP